MEKWMKSTMIFCMITVPIMGAIIMSYALGWVAASYEGFALDSEERLYVGKNTGIEVYENGNKIRTISPPSSRSYVFTISDDKIVSSVVTSAGNMIYVMNLEGEIIEKRADSYDTHLKLKRNSKSFVSESGNEYISSSCLGYYRIMRSDGVCVYSMPVLDYIVNVVASFALGLSYLIFVTTMLIKSGRLPIRIHKKG
ncbi:MAG: hypothetical protein ACI3XO_07400 [Eubacteriales bacterium]